MSNKTETTKPLYNTTIPDGWETNLLDSLTRRGSGHTPDKGFDEYYNGGIKWISLADSYRLDNGLIDETEIEISELGIKKSSAVVHPAGTVLMSRDAGVGKSAVMAIEMAVSQHFIVWRCKKDVLDNWFLYYWLQYKKEYFERQAVGSTIKTIGLPLFKKLKITHPKYPEQKAIAHILGLMDTAINQNNQLIAQKELRKKWLMQNLLTGKKRLKGFSEKWIEYKVLQLFQTIDRYVKWDENEKYNLVSIRRRNGGLFFREPLYGNKIEVKKLKELKNDDFLISKRQVSHGAWAIVSEEFENGKVSDEYDCLELQNKDILSVNFWKWYSQLPILTHYAYVDSNGVHIEKSIFDYNQFKKRKVKIPRALPEQTAIAQVLQAADKEIRLLKTKTDKLRLQKKGMMQVLLTGKKRLKI